MKKLSSHYSLIHNCTKPQNTSNSNLPLGQTAHDAINATNHQSNSTLNSPPATTALSTVAIPSTIVTTSHDTSPTVIDKSILVNDPLHFYHQFKMRNAKQPSEISPTNTSAAIAQQQLALKKDGDQQSVDSYRNIVSVVTTSTTYIQSGTRSSGSGHTSMPTNNTTIQQTTSTTTSSSSTATNSKQMSEFISSPSPNNSSKKNNSPTEANNTSTDPIKQITSNTVLPRLPRIRIPNTQSSTGSNSNTPTNLMTPSSLSNSSSSSSNLMMVMMQDADSPSSCNLLARDAPDNPSFINRRIFVGGLKESTTEQELIDFFSRTPNNYGPISHCVIMKKWDGRSRGFGFVTFSDETIAKKVLADHKEHPFMIGNHRIDCQVAQSQGCKIDDTPTHIPTIPPTRMVVDDERLLPNNSDTQSDIIIHGASSTDPPRSSSSASSANNNSPTIKKETISSFDKKRRIFVGGLQPQVTKQAVHDYFSKHGTIEDLQLILNRRTPFAFITYTCEDSATKVLDDFHSGVLCKEFAAHDVRRAMPKGSFSFTKQREREMDMTRRVPPHRPPPTETSRQAQIPNGQPISASNNGSRKTGHTPSNYRYSPYEKQGSSRRGMSYYDHAPSPANGPMPPNAFFGPVDVPSSHISMYPTGPLHHHHQPPHIDERYMQPGQPLPSTSSFYPPPIPPYYDQPYMMMHHHHHQGMLNGRDQYMQREAAGAYRHSDNISNSSGEMDDIRR